LDEVTLPAHAQPFEQRDGRGVPAVGDGEDPVKAQLAERVVQKA
jgi:hypothetical protein